MPKCGKYYNNGIVNKRFKENEIIPEGFVPGIKPRSEEQKKAILEKRKQTNLERYGYESASQNPEKKEKRRQTCLERFGCESNLQCEEIKERIRQTNLEKYGVDNPSKCREVREKAEQTNLERYGTKYAAQSDIIKEKTKQHFLDTIGVENPFQLEEVKEKSKQACLEKYGKEYYQSTDEYRERYKNTCIEHFGVDNPNKSEEVLEKTKQTNLDRYDVVNVFQYEEFKEKSKQTCRVKYGTDYGNQAESTKAKIRQTFVENYGVDSPMKCDSIKDKLKRVNFEKYGYEYPIQSPEVKEKIRQTNTIRYGESVYSKTKDFRDKVNSTCQERYGVDWPCQLPQARIPSSNSSGPNRKFDELLKTYNIGHKREFSLGSYSYDFKVGNTLIEIDPFITHNCLYNPFNNNPVKENYHQQKSQTAKDNGYHCIHIFDWDNPVKIINSLLLTKEKMYARNTKVFGVTKQEVRDFENEYHLQGYCNGQEVCLGLKDKFGSLVSIMTFGKSRYNKKYQWELLRYCSSKSVVGGAQKLFKYFIDNYNPDSIISYCDRAKFNGNVYPTLGFKLLNSGSPSCHWYEPKSQKHFTDNLVRQRGFDQLMGANYGKGTSNEELLIQHGFVPIYDCGQDTYVWTK